MTHDEIAHEVRQTLAEMFELDPEALTMEARVAEDLDLDSIDAIDMAARVQELAGKRLSEADLLGIRTVGDVVDAVERLMQTERSMTPPQVRMTMALQFLLRQRPSGFSLAQSTSRKRS